MADLIPQLRQALPAVLQDAGENASSRVIEFFTAEIRNSNMREAYAWAVRGFEPKSAGRLAYFARMSFARMRADLD